MPVTIAQIRQAAGTIAGHVVATPCLHSRTLSTVTGAEVFLKFENLQFTASFKERGALNKLATLTSEQRARGVIAVSAGNHAEVVLSGDTFDDSKSEAARLAQSRSLTMVHPYDDADVIAGQGTIALEML